MHAIDLEFIKELSNNLDIFSFGIKNVKFNYLDILIYQLHIHIHYANDIETPTSPFLKDALSISLTKGLSDTIKTQSISQKLNSHVVWTYRLQYTECAPQVC